jgi:hypothetical protein
MAVENPVYFGETYMRPYTEGWDAELPPIAGAILLFCESVKRGVVWTPPEFLKTTTVSHLYPLWLTYREAAKGRVGALAGMLASEEQKLAEKNLAVTSWHIEQNERLARDFVDALGRPLVEPDPDEEKWTDQTIIVRRPGKSKDPTWEAKGVDAKGVQGSRLSHLIGDDVVTPRSAGSPAMQRSALKLWDDQFTYRVLENGRAIIAGNYTGPRDLLATLAKRRSYRVMKRPALHVPGKPWEAPENAADPDAVVALPQKWPRSRLQANREEKPNAFRRMMLMDPKAEVGERLKVAWVQLVEPSATPLGQARYVMALDPAPGPADEAEAATGDPSFFNVSVAALHGEGGDQHLDVLVCHDMRGSTTEQADLVVAYHDEYDRIGAGVLAIGIGKVALDTYFGGAVKILRPDVGRKLVPIPISERSKNDRIEALGPYARSRWLRFWDDAWTELTSAEKDRHQELSAFEQWRDFPAIAHNDKLDAVDVLCRTAEQHGARGTVKKVVLGVAS